MALAEKYIPVADKQVYTEAEYIEFERTSLGRWEYVNGEIRAMSGGTAYHSIIASNIIRTLGDALVPRGCWGFNSDMKVHTGDGVNAFPDVSVVCGPLSFYQGRDDFLLNPLLIVEVLSDSTKPYDRGEKFRHFQTVPTLTDCLLVSQHKARIELFTRRGSEWEPHEVSGLDASIFLPSARSDACSQRCVCAD